MLAQVTVETVQPEVKHTHKKTIIFRDVLKAPNFTKENLRFHDDQGVVSLNQIWADKEQQQQQLKKNVARATFTGNLIPNKNQSQRMVSRCQTCTFHQTDTETV